MDFFKNFVNKFVLNKKSIYLCARLIDAPQLMN